MDRWPEGEEAISKRTSSAYDYAIHVIEGRWPEGEEAISKDAEWWTEYNDFLKWKPYMTERALEVYKRFEGRPDWL